MRRVSGARHRSRRKVQPRAPSSFDDWRCRRHGRAARRKQKLTGCPDCLLYHLIRTSDERWGHLEPQYFGGLEIDHKSNLAGNWIGSSPDFHRGERGRHHLLNQRKENQGGLPTGRSRLDSEQPFPSGKNPLVEKNVDLLDMSGTPKDRVHPLYVAQDVAAAPCDMRVAASDVRKVRDCRQRIDTTRCFRWNNQAGADRSVVLRLSSLSR